jgi:hypothetical protein
MTEKAESEILEVHDHEILKAAQSILDTETSPKKMADAVLGAVERSVIKD